MISGRVSAAGLDRREQCQQQRASDQERDRGVVTPTGRLGVREAVHEREQPSRDGEHAWDVELRLDGGRLVVQQRERAGDRGRREEQVDVHAVAPAQRLRQHATEDQSDRRAAAGERAPDAERLVSLGRVGERRRHQRQRGRREQRSERALAGAGGREHSERLGRAADGRGRREPGQADDERPLSAQQVRDTPAEQQQLPNASAYAVTIVQRLKWWGLSVVIVGSGCQERMGVRCRCPLE